MASSADILDDESTRRRPRASRPGRRAVQARGSHEIRSRWPGPSPGCVSRPARSAAACVAPRAVSMAWKDGRTLAARRSAARRLELDLRALFADQLGADSAAEAAAGQGARRRAAARSRAGGRRLRAGRRSGRAGRRPRGCPCDSSSRAWTRPRSSPPIDAPASSRRRRAPGTPSRSSSEPSGNRTFASRSTRPETGTTVGGPPGFERLGPRDRVLQLDVLDAELAADPLGQEGAFLPGGLLARPLATRVAGPRRVGSAPAARAGCRGPRRRRRCPRRSSRSGPARPGPAPAAARPCR